MSYTVALIGAGQLGSRHLQAMAKSQLEISIEVVEPFEGSRITAEERYHEVPTNQNITQISFLESLDELSIELDIVIIATNSDIRSQIVKDLLSKKKVNYLVLEKVLFQTVNEYFEIADLLSSTQTQCWVNHPRRMFPFYREFKNNLQDAKNVVYTVQGGEWGLACNGLHLIDHLSYLTDTHNIRLDNTFLHNKIYETKRKNFIEVNGELKGTLDNNSFSLSCQENYSPMIITIISDMLTAFIDETNGYVRYAQKSNNWQWKIINTKIVYFQSELTNLIIEGLLGKASCDLPTYNEAMNLHIPFIKSILDKMEKVNGKKYTVCPIT